MIIIVDGLRGLILVVLTSRALTGFKSGLCDVGQVERIAASTFSVVGLLLLGMPFLAQRAGIVAGMAALLDKVRLGGGPTPARLRLPLESLVLISRRPTGRSLYTLAALIARVTLLVVVLSARVGWVGVVETARAIEIVADVPKVAGRWPLLTGKVFGSI